ncbi:hypothetical protein BG000_009814 [Podila horticola]|nr:hypothetical protein BG000_009814 [Podila horticola]
MRFTLALVSAAVLAASAMGQHQCFVPNPPNSGPGICIPTSQCTGGGGSYVSGFCPNDPANVKCCTYGGCKVPNGNSIIYGSCIPSNACTTTRYTGYCPGGSDIQCCSH